MELRIKAILNEKEKERWEELKAIFGTSNNAKTLKKIIGVIKL